jgi:hypothetical protein
LKGIPGAHRAAVFLWPEPLGRPKRVSVDVVRLDDAVLKTPIRFAFDLRPAELPEIADETPPVVVQMEEALEDDPGRPRSVRVKGPEGAVTWRLVERPGHEREVQRIERGGAPVVSTVNTATYCYRLTCSLCGRVRYAKPNSIYQIFWCRVCTRMIRLRKRALTQYKARYGKPR